ncbi:hypothetical protein Smp_155110 [Schistosoma mansoni]|uniref:hypothetical protein n=1 Tax=Schistosoma mansoni TaxID=6183 RepID=UPI0001A63529|nr:hypothetical protein Smp_155110 [Schistosoma mansoni]|eukprot:XP_018655581.1 hypothetical protein Smp_155110 [Schistosoma mansoni]
MVLRLDNIVGSPILPEVEQNNNEDIGQGLSGIGLIPTTKEEDGNDVDDEKGEFNVSEVWGSNDIGGEKNHNIIININIDKLGSFEEIIDNDDDDKSIIVSFIE